MKMTCLSVHLRLEIWKWLHPFGVSDWASQPSQNRLIPIDFLLYGSQIYWGGLHDIKAHREQELIFEDPYQKFMWTGLLFLHQLYRSYGLGRDAETPTFLRKTPPISLDRHPPHFPLVAAGTAVRQPRIVQATRAYSYDGAPAMGHLWGQRWGSDGGIYIGIYAGIYAGSNGHVYIGAVIAIYTHMYEGNNGVYIAHGCAYIKPIYARIHGHYCSYIWPTPTYTYIYMVVAAPIDTPINALSLPPLCYA
jgi:hypothetical protein